MNTNLDFVVDINLDNVHFSWETFFFEKEIIKIAEEVKRMLLRSDKVKEYIKESVKKSVLKKLQTNDKDNSNYHFQKTHCHLFLVKNDKQGVHNRSFDYYKDTFNFEVENIVLENITNIMRDMNGKVGDFKAIRILFENNVDKKGFDINYAMKIFNFTLAETCLEVLEVQHDTFYYEKV